MKHFRRVAVMAASLSLAFAMPTLAQAQSDPLIAGDFSEISQITIDDGHYLEYATFLAGQWRANQEYAKSQGWITGYLILANVNKRAGEPDLILVVNRAEFPSSAEGERRSAQYQAHMKQTDAQMEAASGERAKYRHVIGSQLWQVLNFRK